MNGIAIFEFLEMKTSGIPKGLKGVGYTVEDLEDLTEGAYHRGAQSIMPLYQLAVSS
jgi:hypothetical protein